MNDFDRAIDQLNLSYAQIALIKQAVDEHIIGIKKDIWLKSDLLSLIESEEYIDTREELRVEQRKALYGEHTPLVKENE